MKKRGQAAMEFLMTYGWAILAAIIVIAVLAIYFRPSNLVGQVSVLAPPFTAVSQSIKATGSVADIELKNNGAETITLSGTGAINMTINSPSAATCNTNLSTGQGGANVLGSTLYSWNPGNTLFLRCALTTGTLTAGKSFDSDIRITYTSGSGTLNKTSSGSISGKIDA